MDGSISSCVQVRVAVNVLIKKLNKTCSSSLKNKTNERLQNMSLRLSREGSLLFIGPKPVPKWGIGKVGTPLL